MIDQHEREVTGIDWSKPSHEPRKLSHLQPGWDEIPEQHRRSLSYHPLAAYSDGRAKVKDGINEEDAINHLKEINESWQYAVEHKRAALSYLGSLWLDYEAPTVPDSERKGGCFAMTGSQFLAGDFVHHAPSGEDWILACDEEKGEVMPSGWPMCIAKASDCTLQQQATPEQRLEILNTWAARHPDAEGERDWRTITARRQLSTANA